MHHQTKDYRGTSDEALIGTWRRIGDTGPLYEVLGPGTKEVRSGPSMRVRFPESGEVIDYSLAEILEDRREALCLP